MFLTNLPKWGSENKCPNIKINNWDGNKFKHRVFLSHLWQTEGAKT